MSARDDAKKRGRPLRVAAFGFRSMPPRAGAAGADKFALELLPRLARLGCEVTAYTRIYPGDEDRPGVGEYQGVRTVGLRTVAGKGFDTLLHSAKTTWRILSRDGADVVHIQNGGNSPFALVLRLAGKKIFISQDGPDWKREKWPWYAKAYLRMTQYLTAVAPTSIIFDNVFAREYFETKFRRHYHFVPFGSEVSYDESKSGVVERLGLERGKYVLFVGRFIPDKGLHYLVPAFEKLAAPDLKLVLVGGSPNPSGYEAGIRATTDPRIVMPGFVYGAEMHALMRHAKLYVQPSDVEGLSPVILESAYLGVPILCSDIVQNRFVMRDHALYFRKGDAEDLLRQLTRVVEGEIDLAALAAAGQAHVRSTFNWDRVAQDHYEIFTGVKQPAREPAVDEALRAA